MLELNRMAFDDILPPNSESRCIAVALRLIRKNAPHIKWILSFADGTQCGDGTIYRASGFALTGIKKNKSLLELPSGVRIHELTLSTSPTAKRPELGYKSFAELTRGASSTQKFCEITGAKKLDGYQLRYIKILDPAYHLSVPEIPFSKIQEMGAGMYKGEKR